MKSNKGKMKLKKSFWTFSFGVSLCFFGAVRELLLLFQLQLVAFYHHLVVSTVVDTQVLIHSLSFWLASCPSSAHRFQQRGREKRFLQASSSFLGIVVIEKNRIAWPLFSSSTGDWLSCLKKKNLSCPAFSCFLQLSLSQPIKLITEQQVKERKESEMDGFGIEKSVVDKGQEIVGDIKYFKLMGLVSWLRGYWEVGCVLLIQLVTGVQ